MRAATECAWVTELDTLMDNGIFPLQSVKELIGKLSGSGRFGALVFSAKMSVPSWAGHCKQHCGIYSERGVLSVQPPTGLAAQCTYDVLQDGVHARHSSGWAH
jgi:hypothetical protein